MSLPTSSSKDASSDSKDKQKAIEVEIRAGNRTVYGHGRKFTDRDRVDFFVHGTVKNPTVTLRIDRNGRNGQSNPGLADQDHMQSTSSGE
jgi:hypothetical protein